MGNDVLTLRRRPGAVMGAFAWGHPFLDGNGRTMLLVHAELCHRAGFAIDWCATEKDDYLEMLTRDINSPRDGHLDRYLLRFVRTASDRGTLIEFLRNLPGLDGRDRMRDENVVYNEADPRILESYLDTKRARGELVASEPQRSRDRKDAELS